jgi:hypothetical protein
MEELPAHHVGIQMKENRQLNLIVLRQDVQREHFEALFSKAVELMSIINTHAIRIDQDFARKLCEFTSLLAKLGSIHHSLDHLTFKLHTKIHHGCASTACDVRKAGCSDAKPDQLLPSLFTQGNHWQHGHLYCSSSMEPVLVDCLEVVQNAPCW